MVRAGQQRETSSWAQLWGTSRMAASDIAVRIALRPLSESRALGSNARLVRKTRKRSWVGSIQISVPVNPVCP